MSGGKIKLAVFCAILVAFLAIGGYGYWRYQDKHSWAIIHEAKTTFEKDLARDLTPGSDVSGVMEFMKSHRMNHTDLEQPAYRDTPWYRDAAKTMEAKGPEVESPLYSCSIHLEVKFDTSSKLLSYRDSMPCTGLWW